MRYQKRPDCLLDSEHTMASYLSRLFATMIDFAIGFLLMYIVAEIVGRLLKIEVMNVENLLEFKLHITISGKELNENLVTALELFFGFIPIIYFSLITYFSNGRTIGKMIFGIRIVSLYHHRIGLWHCIERSLGYIASSLELGLGFIQAFWNPNRMTLHDKIAETVVIKTRFGKD